MLATGLVTAATIVGIGGVQLVSADSAPTSTNGSEQSLVDKIASKFHLDKSKVQAVFDEDRQAHHAEMEQKRADALAQAVKDGKLTQAQADHITAVWNEVDAIMKKSDDSKSSAADRQAVKDKLDALQQWAKDQSIDLGSIVGMHAHDMGMRHGGHGPDRDGDGASGTSSSN